MLIHMKYFLKNFYNHVIKDHHQKIPIKKIADLKRTGVPYKKRVRNENWTFDTKPRDEGTGNEVAPGNRFVLEYLVLERRLAAYQAMDLWQYVAHFVNSRSHTRILSIGAGPAAVEMEIARNFKTSYRLDCIDVNEALVTFATDKAKALGLNFYPVVGDVNTMAFEDTYDLVMVVAALHHFVLLERVFYNIHKALKPGGEFVTYEPICRSGMFLYPRQRVFLGLLFLLLPAKYRVNHQDHADGPKVDRYFNEFDRSGWTFECIRSGEIAPLLKSYFKTKHWGRGMTFLRRVSDSIYGVNYDWDKWIDRCIARLLMYADRLMRFLRLLPVEGLFFIGEKGGNLPPGLTKHPFQSTEEPDYLLDLAPDIDMAQAVQVQTDFAIDVINQSPVTPLFEIHSEAPLSMMGWAVNRATGTAPDTLLCQLRSEAHDIVYYFYAIRYPRPDILASMGMADADAGLMLYPSEIQGMRKGAYALHVIQVEKGIPYVSQAFDTRIVVC